MATILRTSLATEKYESLVLEFGFARKRSRLLVVARSLQTDGREVDTTSLRLKSVLLNSATCGYSVSEGLDQLLVFLRQAVGSPD